MCTVVFLPGKDECHFASLRDENPQRPLANVPEIQSNGNTAFLAPVDPLAGGTWIGITLTGNCIILLNGAFEKHTRKSSYQKSRGLIVTELLQSDMPVVDWSLMNLEGIEPFTLIVWSENSLFQLVWDGEKKHKMKLATNQSYLWSSATLYSDQSKSIRNELFQKWVITNPPINSVSVLEFFRSFTENENGFIMNRNNMIRTLSFSFIKLKPTENATMEYHDLVNQTKHLSVIELTDRKRECSISSDISLQ